ncbi:MAG TPA: 3-dehydroquinate synthase [Gemmatimonadaceae bacterium]
MTTHPSFEIDLHGSPIRVAAGALHDCGTMCRRVAPAHLYALITDANVAPAWLAPAREALERDGGGARVITRTIAAGEATKTRETWAALTDWLLANGAGRDTTVVALGGGVVGDLAGFVAATFLRGVPVVQIPTTLLAMVDAAIGGKTGVDTPNGKNLVGAFHPPAAVLIDPQVLATLPSRELRAGLAEVLKHGAIADESYFERAAAWGRRLREQQRDEPYEWGSAEAAELIARSAEIKADVVRVDLREGGRRQVLNAGHTTAHALEKVTSYAIPHGEAVAIGLVFEARLAERCGIAATGTAATLEQALAGAGLPVELPAGADPAALASAMRSDKKNRSGQVRFTLLSRVGAVAGDEARGWSVALDDTLVRDALDAASRPAQPPVAR